jgi:two-component system, OmpR family, heavy metal sensor histidine kinase CusS
VSFRFRLFATASLIVSAVLAAVLIIGWHSVLRLSISRLDNGLCQEAKRLATQPFRDNELARLEADIALKLRLNSRSELLLKVVFENQQSGLQSPNWNHAESSDAIRWDPSPAQPSCSLASFSAHGSQWRSARFNSVVDELDRPKQGHQVQGFVAADIAATKLELDDTVHQTLLFVVPLALLLTTAGAWLLSSLMMRPVNRLRNAMADINQKALQKRLPAAGEDREFKALIADYNTMLDRLEISFQQASRFSADASHELKTPLTILQGRIEQLISQTGDHKIQPGLSQLQDEVSRLSSITRKLLLLSQADGGQLRIDKESLDLTKLLDELIIDAQMLLTSQKLCAFIDRQVVIQGDTQLLRQLFNNLISNAVRYCRANGAISVTCRQRGDNIEIFFVNDAMAISQQNRDRFFERFFRGDAAHNRQSEGNGLGLSLAREIAHAHGGDLTLEASTLNEVKLRLRLPRQ